MTQNHSRADSENCGAVSGVRALSEALQTGDLGLSSYFFFDTVVVVVVSSTTAILVVLSPPASPQTLYREHDTRTPLPLLHAPFRSPPPLLNA